MADLGISAVNASRAHWEKGDSARIAETMRESGEELVVALGIEVGLAVLDHGCGDGTAALPGARLGAEVVGIDLPLAVLARLENAATRLW